MSLALLFPGDMARRTASMDQTAIPGWGGELMDLQRETQKLLASVRSPQSSSTTRRGVYGVVETEYE